LKFVADGMLGKLTRWLRMLGYNVKYSNNLEDTQLLMIAKKERRILLTRDFQLYQYATNKELDAFYLEGETETEKLAELAKRFDIKLDINMSTSRCPKCNSTVRLISKEKAAEKVEKSTFDHYDEFWKCPKCDQIYWQGAHWKRIRRTLDAAQKKLGRLKKEGKPD
jgi:uncharacterized protein with PIN domain